MAGALPRRPGLLASRPPGLLASRAPFRGSPYPSFRDLGRFVTCGGGRPSKVAEGWRALFRDVPASWPPGLLASRAPFRGSPYPSFRDLGRFVTCGGGRPSKVVEGWRALFRDVPASWPPGLLASRAPFRGSPYPSFRDLGRFVTCGGGRPSKVVEGWRALFRDVPASWPPGLLASWPPGLPRAVSRLAVSLLPRSWTFRHLRWWAPVQGRGGVVVLVLNCGGVVGVRPRSRKGGACPELRRGGVPVLDRERE
ncbi:hypothetical protein BJ964_008629 [Actinoplanes lobatus]|uniref:Uncharacterized protein n=1 Tax=Actinoplanes lobatus TaxID=113568 RepID=A0A7W7HPT3_9ACTN|nr:hypothetical protein [Actinoplanes lobatus]